MIKALHSIGKINWIMIFLSSGASKFEDELRRMFRDSDADGNYVGFMIYLDCKLGHDEDRFWKTILLLSRLASISELISCISFDIDYEYCGRQIGVIATIDLNGATHISVDLEDYDEAGSVIESFQRKLRENVIRAALELEWASLNS